MYERFTVGARKVMQRAYQEAQRLNHEYIGTEHILLALIMEGSGVAANVLKNLDLDPSIVRTEVWKIVQPGSLIVTLGQLPKTPGTKKVIEHSIEEARNLNHKYVGTEHLLLGLLHETEGVAAQVLMNLGLNLEKVRKEVLNLLSHALPENAGEQHRWPGAERSTPVPRRWTREEYSRLGEQGYFHGQRVELIEGEIMVLSPQQAEHWTTTDHVAELLRSSFGAGYHVRMQGPIDFGPISEPEPDVAVVVGSRAQYATQHPTTAVLIVEVSESSLDSDRTRKASLYARAGIADYWIVNLVNNQLEVRRDPQPDPTQHYGHGYGSLTTLDPPAVVNPLAALQIALAVADLLP